MELCSKCRGFGTFKNEVCEQCDGEGLSSPTTFVRGKINRRRELNYQEHQASKEVKIDKKNGIVSKE